MTLNTIFALNYGDDGGIIEVGDKIKIYLENGEILIGEYQSSDYVSLNIERENDDMNIDFEDIKDIEILL